MEKQVDGNIGSFVHRRMSQLKVLSRLMEHEISASKGQDVVLDRGLTENLLDTLEIFIDDFEIARGGKAREKRGARRVEAPGHPPELAPLDSDRIRPVPTLRFASRGTAQRAGPAAFDTGPRVHREPRPRHSPGCHARRSCALGSFAV